MQGEIQLFPDHSGTVSVRSQGASGTGQNGTFSCIGRLRYTATSTGAIDLRCSGGVIGDLKMTLLGETRGYGHGPTASGAASLVFSGDTGICDAFWQAVNQITNLKHLIIECAFSNREQDLAMRSKHLCPTLLAAELQKLAHQCAIYITHLKPGQIELTMEEIERCLGEFKPVMLQNSQIFEF